MPRYKRGSGSIYPRRGGWLTIACRVNGRQVKKAAHTKDRGEARRLLDKWRGEIAQGLYRGPAVERTTCNDLFGAVIQDYRINGKKTLRDVSHRIKRHLAPWFGVKRANEISSADVQGFIMARLNAGATNSEINRELAVLKRSFNLGLLHEMVVRKPVIRMLKEPAARRGFFEKAEYERLLAKLPDYLRPVITFAFWTGWRLRSEIVSLTWDQVDLEKGTVRLWAGSTKNAEGRVISLPTELRALLEKLWTEHLAQWPACSLVFHRAGQRIKGIRDAWRSACKEAGLEGRIPHDFRRTAARNMVRAGITERVVMQLLGHKTRSMLDRYNIVNEADLADAAKRLDAAFGSRATATVSEAEEPGTLTH